MPTKREREYYSRGFADGYVQGKTGSLSYEEPRARAIRGEELRSQRELERIQAMLGSNTVKSKPKRKLSAWNKYVKANSKKPRFRYRNGKLNLKKMAVAFRKTRKRGGKR